MNEKSTPVHKLKMREEIIELSTSLFAKFGYDGVSMRDVATAVGVTPAALYYHFSDKEQLYLDVAHSAFSEMADTLKAALVDAQTPWTRLESVVVACVQVLAKNSDLQRLLQWVTLDGDEQRLQKLGNTVLQDLFLIVYDLVAELYPDRDAHMLTISVMGLIVFPFEAEKACRFMPGHRPENEDPAAIAKHALGVLLYGLSGKAGD